MTKICIIKQNGEIREITASELVEVQFLDLDKIKEEGMSLQNMNVLVANNTQDFNIEF